MKRVFSLFMAVCSAVILASCASETKITAQPTTQDTTQIEEVIESSSNVSLFENEFCSLSLEKSEIDSLSDYCWSVVLTNYTENTQIFTFKRAYVNDCDFDPLWVERVDAGKTVESKIIWQSPELQKRGITHVTRVDFNLLVYQADQQENVYANSDLTLYPSGKGAHITHSRSSVNTDVEVVNSENFKFIITGFDGNARWGKAMDVYAVNNIEQRVIFTIENVTLEDQPANPSWSYVLDSKKQGPSQIVWTDAMFSEIAVEGALEFEFDIVIRADNGNVIERIPFTFVP